MKDGQTFGNSSVSLHGSMICFDAWTFLWHYKYIMAEIRKVITKVQGISALTVQKTLYTSIPAGYGLRHFNFQLDAFVARQCAHPCPPLTGTLSD